MCVNTVLSNYELCQYFSLTFLSIFTKGWEPCPGNIHCLLPDFKSFDTTFSRVSMNLCGHGLLFYEFLVTYTHQILFENQWIQFEGCLLKPSCWLYYPVKGLLQQYAKK